MREIAALMGRSLSTISRELARGADAAGRYRPFEAHRRALGRRRLHRPSRLARDAELRDWVTGRLMARWSPEQVSRGLRRQYPDQPARWLCAETIYQAVYRPDLGGLPRELPGRVLRLRRRHRLARRDARARRSGPVTGMTLIHDRPGRGARARRARPLGRRPDHGRRQRVGDRHHGRAHHQVHAAGAPARRQARLGDRARRRGGGPRRPATRPATDADLGPGHGDGAPRRDRRGPGHDEDLLLRSALALAAADQREHQRPAARLLPQGHGPVRPHRRRHRPRAGRAEPIVPGRSSAGTAPPTGWLHSSDHRPCCDVDWNPPPASSGCRGQDRSPSPG